MSEGLLDELRWRGLVHQVTDVDLVHAAAPTRVYIGFDPSADSLHVGSLLQIALLRLASRHGHTPIALLGGGTGLIGDPSGKQAERKLLDVDTVAAHGRGLATQMRHLLDTGADGAGDVLVLDNHEWLGSAGLLTFLRDVGKHFSVGAMVQRDSVRNRLHGREQGISFTEFSYMLLQAWDFLVLYRDHGCRGQLGGSDQWGNIVSGIDLIRRHVMADVPADRVNDPRFLQTAWEGQQAGGAPFGITSPLITKRDGSKFGKTESGNLWLDPRRTSPYRFYQFWINADDDDACRALRYFTLLPREEIEAIEAAHRETPQRRIAQTKIAAELTRWVHGDGGLRHAERATRVLFTGDISGLGADALGDIFDDVPSCDLTTAELDDAGWPLRLFLVGPGRPFASNGEAKKALKAGSVRVNGQRPPAGVGDRVDPATLIEGRLALVRFGKKRNYLVRVRP